MDGEPLCWNAEGIHRSKHRTERHQKDTSGNIGNTNQAGTALFKCKYLSV